MAADELVDIDLFFVSCVCCIANALLLGCAHVTAAHHLLLYTCALVRLSSCLFCALGFNFIILLLMLTTLR